MRRCWAALAVLILTAGAAAAEVTSQAPIAAGVTIYRDGQMDAGAMRDFNRSQGLAMITETRVVDVPAGRSRIVFRGVADTLVPETVAVQGLPGAVIERNEDFDLLSPGSLVSRSLGRTVRVVQTERGKVTERQAVLRSGPSGVLLDYDGRVEALGCGGPPTRLLFDQVPEGLGEKATFSLLADVPKAGRYTVKLSYLATGFTWSADYVARIRPDGHSLDLIGWLTLSNKSSTGFAQAPTDVVAGELARDRATRPRDVWPERIADACWGQRSTPPPPPPPPPLGVPAVEHRFSPDVEEIVVTGSKIAKLSDLGDYKLYTLPEPTTVAARQTKQVLFLDQKGVSFERIYTYRLQELPDEDRRQAPAVVLRMQNRSAAGLGKPLPSGTVSVMEPGPGGRPVLAGEQSVKDTAVGLPLEVEIGRAMDVSVRPAVVKTYDVATGDEAMIEVAFSNGKPIPIVLEYRQAIIGPNFKIISASRPAGVKAGEPIWKISLRPGERETLRYRMRW